MVTVTGFLDFVNLWPHLATSRTDLSVEAVNDQIFGWELDEMKTEIGCCGYAVMFDAFFSKMGQRV